MIQRRAAAQFLSGRLGALGLLLTYQVLLARVLPSTDYAAYALTLAWCGLGQTLLGLGVPRVFSRFLSLAGRGMAAGAGLKLLSRAAIVRLASGGLAGGASWLLLIAWPHPDVTPFVWAGAAWGAFGLLQFELDAAAQALGLQQAARRAALGEPIIRLAATALLALAGKLDALSVLWIGAVTAALASALLFAAVATQLRSLPLSPQDAPLDWRAVRRTALGGHAGALSWALSSPPMIRLIARAALPTEAFAGFSFVQALVVSLQRYAPSFVLFPLLEPAVMAETAATGIFTRLRTTLSLLVKLDLLVFGAGAAGSAAAFAIIPVIAHGRYAEAAPFLPWLLMLAVISAAHRAYEVAAIAVGAPDALGRAFLVSLGWITLAVAAAWRFGLPALLIWPLGEAICRFWAVQRGLDRQGLQNLMPIRALSRIAIAALASAAAAWMLVETFRPGLFPSTILGFAAAALFIILTAIAQPFAAAERSLIGSILRRLIRRPRASGPLRVVVLTPRGRGGVGGVDRLMDALRPRLAQAPDIEARFLTTRGRWRWASPMITIAALVRAGLRLDRTDLVHLNLGTGASFTRKHLFASLCRTAGTPYVLHVHGSGFDALWSEASPAKHARITRLFEGAALVLVLGERWRRMVLGHAPSVTDRLAVLPNASTPVERMEPCAGPARLLFLGEVGERKGVQILMRALALLPRDLTWRAVIAGDGDITPYASQAVQAGLGDRIDFPGHLRPKDVEAALSVSHILVLPSFEENLPLAVIEAMGAGLAVVTTPVGALPDLIRDGETGLLVPVGDAARLAEALERLIRDETLRRQLGAAAKAHHAEHLSLDAYIPTLIALWNNAQRA